MLLKHFFGIVIISCATTFVLVVSGAYLSRNHVASWLLQNNMVSSETGDVVSVASIEDEIAIPDVVERVNPAVVSIIITKDVPVYEQYFEEYFNPFGGWFGGSVQVPRLRESGTKEQEVGGGSGFIVSADGLVITNRHVVRDGMARYSVVLSNGVIYPVEVVDRDLLLDIAILKISVPEAEVGIEFPYLLFGDSSDLRLGETVIAIGNALAEFRNSVSVGIVSGVSRSIVASDGRGMSEQLHSVIQTDAAINPGNSGGPLLNRFGEVIGVNVATSLGAENISFAIPGDMVVGIVNSVKVYGEIRRPILGVRYAVVTEQTAVAENLPVNYGVKIMAGARPEEVAVLPGSLADKAGLKEGDIIVRIDDIELRGVELSTILSKKSIGDSITLDIVSGAESRTVSVVLELVPDESY